MKKLFGIVLFILLLQTLVLNAQPQKIWILSDSTCVNFNTTPPTVSNFPLFSHNYQYCRGNSAIAYSDSSGKLICAMSPGGFMLDGYFYDSTGKKINGCLPKGECLYPPPIMIKHPNSPIIHFFNLYANSVNCGTSQNQECMKLVQHSLLFDKTYNTYHIVRCNKLRLDYPSSIAMIPIKHANGRDWWLILHRSNGNEFAKFLLSNDSLYGPTFQSVGSYFTTNTIRTNFDYSYSEDLFLHSLSGDYIDIFNFNRCTGNLTYRNSPRSNYIDDGSSDVLTFSSYFSSSAKKIVSISHRFFCQFDALSGVGDTIAVKDTIVKHFTTYFSPWVNKLSNSDLVFNFYSASFSNFVQSSDSTTVKYFGLITNTDSAISKVKVNPHAIYVGRIITGYLPQAIDLDVPAQDPLPAGCVLGIQIESKSNKFILYPNPATSSITLKANDGKLNGQLSFYNLSGQVVYQTSLSNESTHEWNVNGLPSGIYYLRLTDGSNEPFVQKVVVNR